MESLKEAVDYIYDIPKFTKKNDLNHTRKFLEALKCSSTSARIIHVAGTNGKGSICRYISSMLKAEGRKVGSFYSPHLVKMNERIVIDGSMVSDEEFLGAYLKVKDVVFLLSKKGLSHPTFFEFIFLMAMYIFKENNVEDIVLETGLGGRLDCTNVFENPAITIISSISKDHEMYLGNRISDIAREKAGIIKENVPVVALSNDDEAFDVIRKKAKDLKSPLYPVSRNNIKITSSDLNSIAFTIYNAYDNSEWKISNGALCQAENAAEAICAMEILTGKCNNKLWQMAIEKVENKGRMEEIIPGVIVDGAHNKGACEAFVETIKKQSVTGKKVLLFSAVSDKDYSEMIRVLKEVSFDKCIVTEISSDRGEGCDALFDAFKKEGILPVKENDFSEAFLLALKEKGNDGYLYCLGSLYLVGMIEDAVGGKKC